jgi:phosphatidylglycerophosphate synthase
MRSAAIDEAVCIYAQRPFAMVFVRRLASTSVTPNQVSVLRAAFGVLGGALLATGVPAFLVLAAVCLILTGFLDSVDGELAAAKGCASFSGRIFDGLADGLVYLAIQVGIYFQVSGHLAAGDRGGLILALVAVSLLQLVAFNMWDFHKSRARRVTGNGRGTAHRPQAVRELLRGADTRSARFVLRGYLGYCCIQTFLVRDRRRTRIWPSDTAEAAFAERALRPIVRGWSILGQATYEAVVALAALVAVFYPLCLWVFVLGLLIVLPVYVVAMCIWTAAVDRRLHEAGIV